VADDLPQAVDDLRRDWSTRRTPTWALDTALPHPTTLTRESFQALTSTQQARLAALLHAETALAGDAVMSIGLPDRVTTLGQAEAALAQARQARVDLDTGRGIWQNTEAGQAVRDLAQAREARQQAEQAAQQGARWRERHAARKQVGIWAQRQDEIEQRRDAHVAPTISRLDQDIALHQATLDGATNQFEHRQAATRAVIRQGLEQQRHASNLSHRVDGERNHLDGVPSAADIRRAATRRQQLDGFMSATQQPPAPRSPRIEM
jgi:hypothetical protein